MLPGLRCSGLATLAEHFFPSGSSKCPKVGSGWPDLGPLLIAEPATVTDGPLLRCLSTSGVESGVRSEPELQGWSQG